jgi:hypothetical protein
MPRVFFEAAIESMRTHIHNACAELVFNLDEIRIRAWEDRIERNVTVPSSTREQNIFHGIRR